MERIRIVFQIIVFLLLGGIIIMCNSCIGFNHNTSSQANEERKVYFPWEDVEIDGDSVNIIGLWFEPHGASHNIVFDSDTTFVYHTFIFPSEGTHVVLDLKGKCERGGNKLNLIGDDGWKSTMYLRHNGTNYFMSDSIKKRGIYLVKSSE